MFWLHVFCGGYSFANLRELMPEALNGAFLEGMEQFGRRIRGFDRADAVLAGIESRTSSPLRICRDESLQSSLKGLIFRHLLGFVSKILCYL